MNFVLAVVFVFLLGCLFLFGLNKIFVFRLIQKKLRWWVLAHWIAAGIALLGKIFLLTTSLQVFEGITIGKSFAENWEIVKNKTYPFSLPWGTYQLDFRSFVIAYLLAVLVQTHLSYLHMYIGWTLEDKIREHLIQDSLTRYIQLPYLETQVIKSKLRNILLLDIPLLSYSFAGGAKGQDFNQIFYQTADTMLTTALLISGLKSKTKTRGILILLGAIIFTLLLVIFLQWLLVKKEKKFKQSLDQESQKIDNLLDNIELLKKKELSPVFLKEIKLTMHKNIKKREKDKFLFVANGVYPNYLLPRAMVIILFAFTLDIQASVLTENVLRQLKSVLVAMRGLPTVLTSSQRLANFYHATMPPTKKKISKIHLTEPIEKIELRNIYFHYPNQKRYLLQNINQEFIAGKITKIEGRNGFGKSTIILLILGLVEPQKGQIIINNHYDLKQLDLIHWRKQIAYASNQTLLKEGSEGEKQIQELEEILLKNNYTSFDPVRKSQIVILDEAWNSLDKNNRDQWKEKVAELTTARKTVTIVVEH
ncbi:ABC transporter permease/ATP-binding protein [endosymbiont GvMRE of Glomus versiforme]|nr:ABC transporter permease/ATP-binding protein [endosymbiont GvMRE of Glomus versiforme]